MRKIHCFFITLFFFSMLSAENPVFTNENSYKADANTESGQIADNEEEANFFTRFKFGLGADFSGTAGAMSYYEEFNCLKNQFGVSLGLDFNWLVFKKERGRGEGNLYLGFGFDFQYWMPTTWRNKDNAELYDDYYYYYDDIDFHVMLHYMRIPVTLNLAYELKAGIGSLKSVEPRVSIGINNNIFKFGWGSSDEAYSEELSSDMKDLNHRIYNYKISGTWSIGLSFVFDSNWFFSTSIGGDFGSSNYKSSLFYERAYERDEEGHRTEKLKSNKYGRFLYGHHEFMMFETGYRF